MLKNTVESKKNIQFETIYRKSYIKQPKIPLKSRNTTEILKFERSHDPLTKAEISFPFV